MASVTVRRSQAFVKARHRARLARKGPWRSPRPRTSLRARSARRSPEGRNTWNAGSRPTGSAAWFGRSRFSGGGRGSTATGRSELSTIRIRETARRQWRMDAFAQENAVQCQAAFLDRSETAPDCMDCDGQQSREFHAAVHQQPRQMVPNGYSEAHIVIDAMNSQQTRMGDMDDLAARLPKRMANYVVRQLSCTL